MLTSVPSLFRLRHLQATGRELLRAAQELRPAELQRPDGALPPGPQRHVGQLSQLVRRFPVRDLAQDPVRGGRLPDGGRAFRIRCRLGDQQGHHQGEWLTIPIIPKTCSNLFLEVWGAA